MAKPSNNQATPAGMHLIQLQNISWGSKLLIPSNLLSQFAELMAKIEVVEEEYLQGGAYTIAIVGEPDYGISTVTGKHVFCASKKEADAFRSYHNATFEMLHNDDRPSNWPCVSIEEFRSQPKVTE